MVKFFVRFSEYGGKNVDDRELVIAMMELVSMIKYIFFHVGNA